MPRSTAAVRVRVVLAACLMPLIAAVGALAVSAPAYADGASLTVEPTTELDPAGSNLTVTGAGYEPNIGLFVVVCDPSVEAGGACDMANFQQAQTDADGAFQVTIKAMAVFGQTDCTKIPCGIQTSKVGDGANRTQERTVPIGFAGGVAPADGWPGVGTADADPGAATSETPATSPDDTDNADDTEAASDDDSSSIAPIVIGVVVAVVVIGGVVLLIRRRKPADIQ